MALWALVLGVRRAILRQWRKAGICLALGAAIGLTFLHLERIAIACDRAEAVLHFLVGRPCYEFVIARLPHAGHRLVVFDWGGSVVRVRGVVYDEGGEVARSWKDPSPEWLDNPALSVHGCKVSWMEPLRPHYYLADFNCWPL